MSRTLLQVSNLLHCREAAKKLKGHFAVQVVFFLSSNFAFLSGTCTRSHSTFWAGVDISQAVSLMWWKKMWEKRMFSSGICCLVAASRWHEGLRRPLSALLRWSARPDKDCEDISLLFRLFFYSHAIGWMSTCDMASLRLYLFNEKRVGLRYKKGQLLYLERCSISLKFWVSAGDVLHNFAAFSRLSVRRFRQKACSASE